MNPETVIAIKEALTPIAEKIGQGAEFGWEVVVRQQFVEAITMFVALGIGLVFLFVGIWAACSLTSRDWDSPVITKKSFIALAGLGIGFFMSLISFIGVFAGSAIGRLINPEYYALQFFISLGTK